MAIPKDPRQLMINLMYLVLTAMLALNVSTEILNAFKTINKSIERSNMSIDRQNSEIYASYDANMQEPTLRDRIAPYYDRAKLVKAESEKMVKYLEDWKEKVIAEGGGRTEEGEINREGDIDAATKLLVEQGGGDELKAKIMQLRNFMMSQLSDNSKNIMQSLPLTIDTPSQTSSNPGQDWTRGYFYNIPITAAVTMFSKFQNDVKNSEAIVIKQLFDEAQGKTIKFDAITAIAVPKTSYVLQGQTVEASIMLAAYNRSVKPQVSASGGRVTGVSDGIATWQTTANGIGLQTVRGKLTVDLGDRTETKDWSFQYMVGTAGASLQLDKMNVLYIGVDNPVTVAAAGYNLEDITLSIPGASVKAISKGKYEVEVAQVGNLTATVLAQGKNVGAFPLRVKTVPDPIAEIGGKTGVISMPTSTLRVQSGVVASLKNFDFDVRYVVVSYEMGVQPKKGGDYREIGTINGAYFSGDAKTAIDRAKPGDRIYIENIKARMVNGKDQRLRTLSPVTINCY